MLNNRMCVATLLLFGWLSVGANAFAQPPAPGRDGGAQPDGPPPADRNVDRPPRRGPRGDGPPHLNGRRPDSPRGPHDGRRPHNGPPHDGHPHDGHPRHGPPHGRFGHEHELRLMAELKELDPEMYDLEKTDLELDRKTMELSEQFHRAPKDKRDGLKKQLAEVVDQHFTVRQSRRELHIKRLAEELEKLRESIERRNEVRDQIIARRVSELMGQEDDLAF